MNRDSIVELFCKSVDSGPERIALVADGRSFSYSELAFLALKLAKTLDGRQASRRIGIYAHRTGVAYMGILAALASGRTYVPLNPRFPPDRNDSIVRSAGVQQIILDNRFLGDDFIAKTNAELIGVDLESEESSDHDDSLEESATLGAVLKEHRKQHESHAYIMFTSGTTGVPKGVPITHANVIAYVANILDLAELCSTDRCSQTFDLTFDLSVHDMFVCWAAGASLHVLPEKAVMAPAKFIKEHELTVWFSVPSTIGFMKKLRTLRPNAFPSLRCSWFCGEALPAESAEHWKAAAPNSFVENLYGPTEATIAFTAYRWSGDEEVAHLSGGYVPIGKPMGTLETIILDENHSPVESGKPGELCLGGNQLSPGYWNNEDKTAEVFLQRTFEGRRHERWYRTGDLVKLNINGDIEFVGRIDNQVKILGHRVELGEIERAVRQAAGTELAAAIAWPRMGSTASGVVVFTCGGSDDVNQVMVDCAKTLAPYMVPKIIRKIDTFPMNANGKVDRRELEKQLQNENKNGRE
ncbi:MAG: amino acid adenylation domain-containing protein [Gammaproteobacteria bacterium]|nr:amino acid adenylation domain-containing protein [Gammaproteobacteria bacterium]